jgi:murein DD-endopeptidase MepM/ murein hydrolase activator NlpD
VRRRSLRHLIIGIIFAGAYLAPHQGPPRAARTHQSPRAAVAALFGSSGSGSSAVSSPLPDGWLGPDWESDPAALAALGRDTWIHPLAGPFRRMPIRDSRVFGAARPGDRPAECRNGHCGVDLGGEIWGEHVHAVHDGVVDWVKRGVNPDRGGQFVRLSHRGGTVFTQYFHLAAIPRGLERGSIVKSGDVIGLLGDTGVKESGPHLHFTIAVRPAKDWPERYMDPEPLIALWPLRVPVDGSEVGLVNTVAPAGTPLGSSGLIPGRKRKAAKAERGKAGKARAQQGEGQEAAGEEKESAAPASEGESEAGEPSSDE